MGNDSGLIVFSLFIGSINQALAKLTTLTAQLGPQKPIRYAEMGGLKLPDPWVLCFAAFFWGGKVVVCLFEVLPNQSFGHPIFWRQETRQHQLVRRYVTEKRISVPWRNTVILSWPYIFKVKFMGQVEIHKCSFLWEKHMFFRHLGLNKMLRWKLSLSIIPGDWRN